MFRANDLNHQICILLEYFYHLSVICCYGSVRTVGPWVCATRLLTYRAVLEPRSRRVDRHDTTR
jgi:hypothetical protein